ncbi:MAG: hypothetical protein ACD_76C00033G0003 [uncultured bacterium]|nr:MAG: hypothetical protein ACD_76C00033G0003 [uncultured bacterium]
MRKASDEQKNKTDNASADVRSPDGSASWLYSSEVRDHFFNPRNFVAYDPKENEFDAHASAGSPACGDEMHVWLNIDSKTKIIKQFRWRTFGCASAIASTSMLSVMVTENSGMTLDEARAVRPQHILERLGGLPARKIHCSVLSDRAMRNAINDYYKKIGENDKIVPEAGGVVCPNNANHAR